MVKKSPNIVATVTVYVQGHPPVQGDESPRKAQECPAGNPSDKFSRSRPRRPVSIKAWFTSVCIILAAIAFSSFSWFDSLDSLRSKDDAKTFVRRPIVNPHVSLATVKVPSETLNTMAPDVVQDPIGGEQPEGKRPNEATQQQTKAPQAPTHAKPLPGHKATLFSQALALHKDGRLQEAKKMYEAALEHSPKLVWALNNLGTIYIREKDYPEAHRILKKATQADASYADPYYNLACLHALQTNVEQSLSYLKQAIAADDTVRDLAQGDKDLGNLRGHTEYERILKGVKKP